MAEPGHLDPTALEASAARVFGPFQPDHLAGLLGANVLGAALVFAGWWAASGLGQAKSQLAWLNLSLAGLVLAGAANGLWLARGRRAVTLARAAVLPYPPVVGGARRAIAGANGKGAPAVLPMSAKPHPGRAGSGHRSAIASVGEGLVAGGKMSRYHRASCLLVASKQVRVATRAEHERAGLAPCEVCLP